MKQIIVNYTFSASGKTVTLTDFSTVRLDRLQLIVDTTTNTILYNFADSSVATATVATNVITLSTVGSAASTDKLQIIYDCLTGDPTYDTPSLPNNAAKETGGNLAAAKTDLDTLAGTVSGGKVLNTETNSAAIKSDLDTIVTNTNKIPSSPAQDGTDGTGITPPTGASGIRGWLSGIYNRLTGTLTVTDTAAESSLSTIATDIAPLVASAAGGYVRQDSNATIAKESGGNLAAAKTDLDTIVTNTGNAATSANQTNGNQKTQIVDPSSGSGANVLVAGTSQSTGDALLTAGTSEQVSFSTTSSAAVASTDAGNYAWVGVQVNGVGTSATINFQGSHDGTTWFTVFLYEANTTGLNWVSSIANTTNLLHGPLPCRYFRLNVTGQTAGTTSGVVNFFTNPRGIGMQQINAVQSGTWTVGSNSATGSAIPANAFFVGLSDSGGNLQGLSSIQLVSDGNSGNKSVASGQIVYNGTNYDRVRSASAANNTTGTGLFGAGILAVAENVLRTAATIGNYVTAMADKFGRLVVIPQTTRDLVGTQDTSITVNTATTVVSAAGAGILTDISSIVFTNNSATAVTTTLSDGTANYHFYVPAGDMRGATYQVPLPATTANTAWTVTSSAAISTLYVDVTYIKNQ